MIDYVPEQPLTPEDMPNIYSDEPMRCACGNPIDETSWDKCSDCLVPKCEACNEPRAVGDEADSCILHNYLAALEDLPERFNQEAQYRVYRWRMACEKAGITTENMEAA